MDETGANGEQAMTTRYKAEYLLIGGDSPAIIADGAVDVIDGSVAWSGPRDEAPQLAPGSEITISGILMPGFVNAHCHTPMVLLRGAGEGLPVDRWLSEAIWPREARLTPDDVYWGMSLGAAEQLRNGVTTTVEMYFFSEQIAQAASDAGLRSIVTATVIEDSQLATLGSVEQQLEAATELRDTWRGSNRIEVGLGPHSVYAVPEHVLREIAATASTEDLMIHMHVAELATEHKICEDRFGMPLVAYIEDVGLLETHLLSAHGVWLTDSDQARLAEGSVGVAHCPTSNLRHASGIAPIVDMRQRGLAVGLGTDGPASDASLDMFAEMRLAMGIARVRALDAQALGPLDVFAMATSEAARAAGRTDIGSLQPGSAADMVNISIDGPAFAPIVESSDIFTHLVWGGSARDVRNVWVGGRMVVEDGECLTVDVPLAIGEVTTRARRLAEG